MTVYSGPVFEMAVNQFNVIANHLEIPMDERDRLLMPKRAVTVSCPDPPRRRHDRGVRRLPRAASPHDGPDQGRHPLCALRRHRRGGGAGDLDELEMRAVGLPYGGAKGGVNVDLSKISKRELESLSRRYMQEMIPFVGPHTDVMAPDHGTNEQVMACVHGHLFHVPGPDGDGDRHGKAGRFGRHARPSRGDRARGGLSRETGIEGAFDRPRHRHGRDPGVWQCRLLCRAGIASIRPQGDRGVTTTPARCMIPRGSIFRR